MHICDLWDFVQVKSEDECWPWLRCKERGGYGRVWWNGKNRAAHQVVYELVNGSVPPGKCVCHTCDNPACCNPAHLWAGTHQENTADKVRKGRQSRVGTTGPRKVSISAILDIRHSTESAKTLAARHGISRKHVWAIRSGRVLANWA